MIPIEHNNHLLVEVPKGSNRFVIAETLHGWVIRCFHGKTESTWDNDIPIKPISYSIVGLAKDLTREQKMEIEPKGTAAFNRLLDDNGLKDSTALIIKKL